MTKHVAINAVLALGMLLVILKGGIDLSVGSIVGLSGVVCGELLQGIHVPGTDTVAFPPVWVVVILAIAVGSAVGSDQRHPGDPVQRRAVHSDARHALCCPRYGPAHLRGIDLSRSRRRARPRKHRLLLHRQRSSTWSADVDLGDDLPCHLGDHPAGQVAVLAGGSTRRAATSGRPSSPACPSDL